MAVHPIAVYKKEALAQLTAYRRNCLAVKRGETPGRQARAWMRVIARVRKLLKEEDPLKEKFMERLFGLDLVIPQRKTARERLIKLSMELHCSEATLYNWRAEIVELVLYGAIEARLIQPFGGGKSGRETKNIL